MARLRIRYHVRGDAPGQWGGELTRDDEIPDLGQDIVLTGEGGPRRYRVVAMLFKATVAFVGVDADVYVASADPAATPPPLIAPAEPGRGEGA